jgi:hypothetical protein
VTDGRSTPQDLLDFLRARLPEYLGSVAEMVAWASTLPTGQAEADDDFFAVGGNSLSVVHGMGVAGVRRVTEDTGNETTKNATTGGLVAFSRNPDRWHLLRRQPELLDSAVEEILRYTSVIQHVTRTVLRPQTLAGTGLYPGDLLCVWVASANRDEEVFTDQPDPRIRKRPRSHYRLVDSSQRVVDSATPDWQR